MYNIGGFCFASQYRFWLFYNGNTFLTHVILATRSYTNKHYFIINYFHITHLEIRMDVDFILLKRFIFGSIAGVPFGILIFISVNINTFKLTISILLLLLTLLLICNVKVRSTPFRDFVVGGLSGLLTTSIGMPGPPLLLYFTGTDTEKEKLRATTLAFYLFIYFISLLTQILFTGTNITIWKSSFYAIPIVFLGLFIGQIIFKWLNQQVFKIFTYILLSCTGIYLLIDSLHLL